jgi:hypothetical protein
MPVQSLPDLSALYETDETAWLEAMASLIERGEFAELDYPHLAEYLSDMSKRDRREVFSRLVVLLTHWLNWRYQPQHRSNSWRASIIAQRLELRRLANRGVLRSHAEAVLADAYTDAVEIAAAETSLAATTFPAECPFSLNELLTAEPLDE